MIGIAIGLGGLIALIAALLQAEASKRGGGEPEVTVKMHPAFGGTPKPYAAGLPADVKSVVLRQSKGGPLAPTKTELQIAASSASVAGYTMLGEELTRQAEIAPETYPGGATSKPKLPSPLGRYGVSSEAWTAFVRKQATGAVDDVGPRGVGTFSMPWKRLADLGAVRNPRKVGGSWTADFVVPREAFLHDRTLQYKLWRQSTLDHADKIAGSEAAKLVGQSFEGARATLSGLLAVAGQCGIPGLLAWARNDPPRSKFPATVAAYKAANGIF
jgi:hypothetical protein